MHLAEASRIEQNDIHVIDRMLKDFVIQFPRFYSKRHCVQVVHSIYHLSASVRDFGPLPTFSTFNFESHLGTSFPSLSSHLFLCTHLKYRHDDTLV